MSLKEFVTSGLLCGLVGVTTGIAVVAFKTMANPTAASGQLWPESFMSDPRLIPVFRDLELFQNYAPSCYNNLIILADQLLTLADKALDNVSIVTSPFVMRIDDLWDQIKSQMILFQSLLKEPTAVETLKKDLKILEDILMEHLKTIKNIQREQRTRISLKSTYF